MRLPVPQQRGTGLETIGGVAAVAALLAVSTGIPLAEMATDWLPAATGAPLLVGGIWVVAFGWFWAGVRGWLSRGTGLDR